MAYVIKIKHEDTLRRLTFQSSSKDDLTFSALELKIRDIFKLPAGSQIRVTYDDKDNDVITMADDQDLMDALVIQNLNPLRMHVNVGESKSRVPSAPRVVVRQQGSVTGEANDDVSFNDPLQSVSHESVKQMLTSLEPLFKSAASSPRFSDLVEKIVKMMTTQISSAVEGVETGSRPALAEMFASRRASRESAPALSATVPNVASNPVAVRSEPSASPVKSGILTEILDSTNTSRVFHTGVQCDVCGMNPIVGPRFKSLKKHDYDLCPNCFKEFGHFGDYSRIDRPLFRPRHLHSPSFGRMRCPALNPNAHAGRPVTMRGPYGIRPEGRSYQGPGNQLNGGMYGGKLDARFVQDVTILDGTELAPGTSFTKIWRLRNSGTLPWAPQTKLVHVGGDELGSVFVVPLELPEQGLAPDQEVNAAVQLIAPEKPGRYVSHWRLASPAGPKFGHRVWVLIQVVPKESSSSEAIDVAATLEDNREETELLEMPLLTKSFLPREAFVTASHGALVDDQESKSSYPVINVAESPALSAAVEEPFSGLDIGAFELANESKAEEEAEKIEPVTQEDVAQGEVAQEEVVAVENSELGGGFSMVEMPLSAFSRVNSRASSPKRLSEVSMASTVREKLDVENSIEEVEAKPLTPESLSAKLEAMGFTDRALNVELLLKNKLDLRRTLDDLFAAGEWDPILEELEDMGFYDTQMNRRLMFKNNGSVKRVVKELVQMYKEPAVIEADKSLAQTRYRDR